jgi:hypothetical protein
MRFFTAVAASLVAFSSATSIPFNSCGDGILSLTNLDASPFPLQKGANVTLTASGSLSEQFVGGQYTVKVSVDGLQIVTLTGDACTLSETIQCPLNVGDVVLSETLLIPALAPSGAYTIEVSAANTDGSSAFCFSSDVTLDDTAAVAEDLKPNVVFTTVPFTSCGTGDFTATSLDVTPWPPVKGQSVTLKVDGTLASQVTSGNYTLSVAWDGITVINQSGDLCTLSTDLVCPQSPAALDIGYSVTVPSYAPSGSYEVTFEATQQDSATLFCMQVPFTM